MRKLPVQKFYVIVQMFKTFTDCNHDGLNDDGLNDD